MEQDKASLLDINQVTVFNDKDKIIEE